MRYGLVIIIALLILLILGETIRIIILRRRARKPAAARSLPIVVSQMDYGARERAKLMRKRFAAPVIAIALVFVIGSIIIMNYNNAPISGFAISTVEGKANTLIVYASVFALLCLLFAILYFYFSNKNEENSRVIREE
jgi:uncharacterized BrkB/YihY/UPF0761 family membrane protein